MRRLIFILLFFSTNLFAFDSAFWSDIQKFSMPKYRWGATSKTTKAKKIFFEGETYKGKPTEVFAYYCTPSILKNGDTSADKNLPAVVCVHGGGGRAFAEWVELWAKCGYAAIAIDWRGNGDELKYQNPNKEQRKKYSAHQLQARKHLENGGPEHAQQTTSLDDNKSEKDAWAYHAVGAIVRAHTLIRSFKEVDANKTAITGISWGGYLTWLVSGIDNRFKVAVPVYGCGYINEFPQNWQNYIGKNPQKTKRWIDIFEPSQSLSITKTPMLFVNAPTDQWYPLSIWTKSVKLANAQTLLISTLKHGHHQGWNPPEIEAFIASIFNGENKFVKLEELQKTNSIAYCQTPDTDKIKSAELFYTTDTKPLWKDFKWQSTTAKITNDKISATIPENTRAFYISVTDTQNRRITTNAILTK